jgi:alkylated DNA repair dioxygenase AlkB
MNDHLTAQLAATGWALIEGFVADPDAAFVTLRDEVEWTRQMHSRETASMGIPYNYAGASYPEAPWHPAARALADQVGAAAGFTATNALLNRYPTGEHSLGWHSDDVTILAPGTPIAILSFGATRTLHLRRGAAAPFALTLVPMPPGSLFVMTAAIQADHRHCLRREPGAGERISLTLRHLTHAPPPVDRPRWGR